jgi:hypothetical protein
MAAFAHAEQLASTDGPESVWWLSLVRLTGDGEICVIAEGPELLG